MASTQKQPTIIRLCVSLQKNEPNFAVKICPMGRYDIPDNLLQRYGNLAQRLPLNQCGSFLLAHCTTQSEAIDLATRIRQTPGYSVKLLYSFDSNPSPNPNDIEVYQLSSGS
jgi:hypothetical protein